MEPITGTIQHYAWGSTDVLADFMGREPTASAWAEVWFGSHPLGPTLFPDGSTVATRIAADPQAMLGDAVVAQFGSRLPYLLKFIAPAQPLSLQVHPSKQQAAAGWASEEAAGIPLSSPARNYRDANHKPELIYALTGLEALAGFRAPRRAAEIVDGLASPLARQVSDIMRANSGDAGLEAATRFLLEPETRPTPEAVAATVAACEERLASGTSPSVRADRVAVDLQAAYPGDPAVVLALLLNPVSLRPGEVLFTPAGSLHCYLLGLSLIHI